MTWEARDAMSLFGTMFAIVLIAGGLIYVLGR